MFLIKEFQTLYYNYQFIDIGRWGKWDVAVGNFRDIQYVNEYNNTALILALAIGIHLKM